MTEIPFLSIILPIRNEASTIAACLEGLIAQDYPKEKTETLVVDGLSEDQTREIASSFSNRLNLRIIDNPGRIVPTGMNLALRQARGDMMIRVDGHTLIAPDYVRQCVRALQRSAAENVGGRMCAIGNTPFGNAVALATSSLFGVGGSRFHYSEQEEWVDSVYMGAWPRSVFENIGLFDEELVRNQDDEFNYRLRKAGGKILLSPAIKSEYTVRGSPKKLWKQYFQYGFWKVRVLQKHPRQMSLRQFVPPLFVASLLLALVLALVFPGGWLILTAILVAYLLANLAASIITSAKRGWQHLPLLPLVFAILHLSYGSGFLAGLVKFANRWSDRSGKVPFMRIND